MRINKTKQSTVRIEELAEDTRFQSRTRTDRATVEEYKELMSEGVDMPPITVALVDDSLFIVDGWHRVQAAKELDWSSIPADVSTMTENEAIWKSAGANQSHGLRRSNADKLRAVETALSSPTSEMMSDREIARKIGVSHEFVRRRRTGSVEDNVEEVDNADATEGGDVPAEEPAAIKESDGSGSDLAQNQAAAKRKYIEIIAMIDAISASLAMLSEDPSGYSVNWNALNADIKNAKRCLTDAMPHGVCVYCNGEGCDACKYTGWLGKVAISMAPTSLKKSKK